MSHLFTGVGVALLTLFDDDGGLDAPATARLAARLVGAGVRAVLVAGSTGEASALDGDERLELLATVRPAVGHTVPVIAGVGAPSARQAGELTAAAVGAGADAVLAFAPPGSDHIFPYYERVAARADGVPVLAYHFPRISLPGVPVGALAELPVAGIKDSSGDPARFLEELDVLGSDRSLYTGSSSLTLLAGAAGATGALLGIANAEPARCVEAFGGDVAAQREIARADRRARWAFPAGLKALTAARFGTSTASRLG